METKVAEKFHDDAELSRRVGALLEFCQEQDHQLVLCALPKGRQTPMMGVIGGTFEVAAISQYVTAYAVDAIRNAVSDNSPGYLPSGRKGKHEVRN